VCAGGGIWVWAREMNRASLGPVYGSPCSDQRLSWQQPLGGARLDEEGCRSHSGRPGAQKQNLRELCFLKCDLHCLPGRRISSLHILAGCFASASREDAPGAADARVSHRRHRARRPPRRLIRRPKTCAHACDRTRMVLVCTHDRMPHWVQCAPLSQGAGDMCTDIENDGRVRQLY
jgi:hypothetical protein